MLFIFSMNSETKSDKKHEHSEASENPELSTSGMRSLGVMERETNVIVFKCWKIVIVTKEEIDFCLVVLEQFLRASKVQEVNLEA